jgi:hypothetical protein
VAEYTPTTEQVREAYSHDAEAEYRDPITNHAAQNRRAFNRWLSVHDAEVRAAALEEAATVAESNPGIEEGYGVAHATRIAAAIRALAVNPREEKP